MPTLVFPALQERIPATRGDRLLDLCERHSLPVEAACGGFAACNTCRLRVLSGAEALSPIEDSEEPFLDRADQRLACQAYLTNPALGEDFEVVLALDPG